MQQESSIQNGNLMQGNSPVRNNTQDEVGEIACKTETSAKDGPCTMTFEELEIFEGQAEKIELFNLKPYWPTQEDIDRFSSKFDSKRMALFLNWLLDMNGEPETNAQKSSFSAMHHYINEHIVLSDEGTV